MVILQKFLPYDTFVSYDFEWKEEDNCLLIWEAGFVNMLGDRKVLHETDFSSHHEFIKAIFNELLEYECKITWNGLGKMSDNEVLRMNLDIYGIDHDQRVLRKGYDGNWYFKGANIDLMKVFDKKLVQYSVFNEKYRNLKLETVAQAFLGRGKKGKAIDIHEKSIEEQREYVLEDAQLVRELLEVGEVKGSIKGEKFEGGLMKLMEAIYIIIETSRTINKKPEERRMPYDRVCNTNLTTWWARILDNYNAKPASPNFRPVNFEGGFVMEPIRGYYVDLDVLDVQSLYPTAIINYNLSHEVMCCEHESCKNGKFRIPETNIWACEKKAGLFSTLMKGYKAQRVKEKEEGNELMATGLKIFLNGGYGGYGSDFFKYADVRVAEGTTAIGRYTTMKQLKPKAESLGIIVVYSDTDSLFIKAEDKSKIKELIEWAKKELDIVLEHEKTFKWCILASKKHYLGRTTKGKLIIKGMEGMKKDRCKWVRNTFDKVVEAIEKNEPANEPYFKAIEDLENNRVDSEDLKYYIRVNKRIEDYPGNPLPKQVAVLHNASKHDVVWYFKGTKEVTLEYEKINKKRYLESLEAVCKDIIELKGFNWKTYECSLF